MTSQSPPQDDDGATRGFDDGERYASARPDYPLVALAHLVEHLGIDEATRVLDVGAGTGIFTAQLAPFCGTIVGVEPSAGMRAAFASEHPDLVVRDGRDDALGVDDHSVDVITVAQAFHWFDPPRALAEFARALTSSGRLGLIWNERDESVPWVREMSRAMLWDVRQPYRVGMDFTPVIDRGPFRVSDVQRFTHVQLLDRDRLDQRVLSTSYIALMSSSEQREILERVHAVVGPVGETIELPYVTTTYCATLSL